MIPIIKETVIEYKDKYIKVNTKSFLMIFSFIKRSFKSFGDKLLSYTLARKDCTRHYVIVSQWKIHNPSSVKQQMITGLDNMTQWPFSIIFQNITEEKNTTCTSDLVYGVLCASAEKMEMLNASQSGARQGLFSVLRLFSDKWQYGYHDNISPCTHRYPKGHSAPAGVVAVAWGWALDNVLPSC